MLQASNVVPEEYLNPACLKQSQLLAFAFAKYSVNHIKYCQDYIYMKYCQDQNTDDFYFTAVKYSQYPNTVMYHYLKEWNGFQMTLTLNHNIL